jgi:hypothetical protein
VRKGYEIFSSVPSLRPGHFNRLRTGDASPLPVLLAPLEREPGGPPFRNPMKCERGETQRLGKRGRFSKVSILDSQESSLICKNKPNSAKTGYYAKSYNHLDGFYAISMRSQ